MHLADFETAARADLPMLVAIMNNQAFGGEYQKMRSLDMNAELSAYSTPDLGAIARDMGGRGALVRNDQELRAAVKEWVANPRPMMIDVRTSRSVLNIPWRRTHGAKDE